MRIVVCLVFLLDLFLQNYFRFLGIGVENKGVSFGLGAWWGTGLSLAMVVVAFGGFLFLRLRDGGRGESLLLMFWGGLSNILNRLYWGSVWDYITVPFLPFSFNLADVLISLGLVSYILGTDGNRNTLRR